MSTSQDTAAVDFDTRVRALQERIDEQKRILDARDGVTHRYSYLTGQLEAVA